MYDFFCPTDCNLELPPWLCKSYVRDSPEEHISKIEAKRVEAVRP